MPQLTSKDFETVKIAASLKRRGDRDFSELYSAGLLGLAKAIQSFKPGGAACFTTYARYRIRGEISDFIRNSNPRKRRMEGQPHKIYYEEVNPNVIIDPATPETEFQQKADVAKIHNAINQLKPNLRDVIWLRYIEEKSLSEIMQKTKYTKGTILFYIHMGKKELKKILA